jgi:hypothetical protein
MYLKNTFENIGQLYPKILIFRNFYSRNFPISLFDITVKPVYNEQKRSLKVSFHKVMYAICENDVLSYKRVQLYVQ